MYSISPEALDALGEIFVHLKIGERYGISFEKFVQLKLEGKWEAYVSDKGDARFYLRQNAV